MTVSFNHQLEQVTELISLPEIYLKIHALMDDSNSDIDDFARVIRLDTNLAAKLLKAANSAYYGFSGEVANISRAVYLMGIQQVHMMVLSISAVSAVSSLNFPRDIVDLKSFWRTSLLAGTLAQLLAKQMSLRPDDRFFMLGLLHEIGHLVLYSRFPELARETSILASEQNLSIDEAESRVLGCHYGNIGAKLMEQWDLPVSFQNMTNYQPRPEQATGDQVETSILHIAHAVAHKHYMSPSINPEEAIVPFAWQATGLTMEQVEQLLESALATSAEMEKAILQ